MQFLHTVDDYKLERQNKLPKGLNEIHKREDEVLKIEFQVQIVDEFLKIEFQVEKREDEVFKREFEVKKIEGVLLQMSNEIQNQVEGKRCRIGVHNLLCACTGD